MSESSCILNSSKGQERDHPHEIPLSRNMQSVLAVQRFYAYSVVTLGKQQDRLRCQRSLRDREPGRAQAGASINIEIIWEVVRAGAKRERARSLDGYRARNVSEGREGREKKSWGVYTMRDVDYASVERRGDNASFVASGPAWLK
jgi:hypothetical protein